MKVYALCVYDCRQGEWIEGIFASQRVAAAEALLRMNEYVGAHGEYKITPLHQLSEGIWECSIEAKNHRREWKITEMEVMEEIR